MVFKRVGITGLKSKCQQGYAPFEGCRGESFLVSSPSAPGGSRYSLTCRCVTPISASVFAWPSLLHVFSS